MVAVSTAVLVAFAARWAYSNVDQAYYLDGSVAFYHVATGYEFLVIPLGWVPSWLFP